MQTIVIKDALIRDVRFYAPEDAAVPIELFAPQKAPDLTGVRLPLPSPVHS